MGQEMETVESQSQTVVFLPCLQEPKQEQGDRGLLLQAFEMFTQASSSLESAFSQLQARVHRLTEELEAKNLELERSLTEVKALQEQNKRVERLSAMGEMAVELAHEIRNPLGSIELFASLLVQELSGDSMRWAENIRIGIRSLNTIVSNMLHFANPLSPSFCTVDLHDLIREILMFAGPIMNQRDVRVRTALDADNPMIVADPELIKQMLLNLIFNAMKAMPSEGSLTIGTCRVDIRGGDRPARGLELKIQDTGIGIAPENLDHIFDPFFTTNRKGTGLGLSVVHQIVEKHSGSISVKSEVNRGTTFHIAFKNAPEKG